MEDSTGCMHGSRGQVKPASPHLLSEQKIVAELAKATAPSGSTIPWDEWVADYSKIRDAIAATYPDIFHDFNARMWKPGGFPPPDRARKREWKTKTGKANFITPTIAVDGHRYAGRPARRRATDDFTQQRTVQHDSLQLR